MKINAWLLHIPTKRSGCAAHLPAGKGPGRGYSKAAPALGGAALLSLLVVGCGGGDVDEVAHAGGPYSIRGGAIPKEYIPAVESGVKEAMSNGVLVGFQTVDVKVTLTDGKTHDVDSSEMAFKIAGNAWFREAARMAKPRLLEPMMAVEVVVPEDFMGDVIGDLSKRRGKVEGMDSRGNARVVSAQVPLAEMFGYATELRSMTQGRANYTMQFHSYQQVPDAIANEIVAKVRGE